MTTKTKKILYIGCAVCLLLSAALYSLYRYTYDSNQIITLTYYGNKETNKETSREPAEFTTNSEGKRIYIDEDSNRRLNTKTEAHYCWDCLEDTMPNLIQNALGRLLPHKLETDKDFTGKGVVNCAGGVLQVGLDAISGIVYLLGAGVSLIVEPAARGIAAIFSNSAEEGFFEYGKHKADQAQYALRFVSEGELYRVLVTDSIIKEFLNKHLAAFKEGNAHLICKDITALLFLTAGASGVAKMEAVKGKYAGFKDLKVNKALEKVKKREKDLNEARLTLYESKKKVAERRKELKEAELTLDEKKIKKAQQNLKKAEDLEKKLTLNQEKAQVALTKAEDSVTGIHEVYINKKRVNKAKKLVTKRQIELKEAQLSLDSDKIRSATRKLQKVENSVKFYELQAKLKLDKLHYSNDLDRLAELNKKIKSTEQALVRAKGRSRNNTVKYQELKNELAAQTITQEALTQTINVSGKTLSKRVGQLEGLYSNSTVSGFKSEFAKVSSVFAVGGHINKKDDRHLLDLLKDGELIEFVEDGASFIDSF